MMNRNWTLASVLVAFVALSATANAQECPTPGAPDGCNDGGTCVEYTCTTNGADASTKTGYCEYSELCPAGAKTGDSCGNGKACRVTGTFMSAVSLDGGGESCGATVAYCWNRPPDGGGSRLDGSISAGDGGSASAGGRAGSEVTGAGGSLKGTGGATSGAGGGTSTGGSTSATGGGTSDDAGASGGAGATDATKSDGDCSCSLGERHVASSPWSVVLAAGCVVWARRRARR
jgi:hypothetical protein